MLRLIGSGWTMLPKRLMAASVRVPVIIDQVVAREAHRFRNEVIKAFRTQSSGGKAWKPLSRITLALRRAGVQGGRSGGSKAMVRSGSLRNSTKVHRRGYGRYEVTQHRKGRRNADVAKIHDSGPIVIPISKKMRQYFNYMFFKGIIPFTFPRRARFIVIPRRSSMTDTFNEFKKGSRARVLTDFAAQMRTI